MTYLICNIFNNNGVYSYELRNKQLDKIFIKSNEEKNKYKIGEFVEVDKYQNRLLIKDKILQPSDFLDYYPQSVFTLEERKSKLSKYIEEIKNEEYLIILEELIKEDKFYLYPAAKAIHHAYIGGLVEHTLNMLEISQKFIEKYELNRDLLYMGIILHDYSKIEELESYGLTYTVEGNLIGHLVMCVEKISTICYQYSIQNSISIIALKHMILSHHGKLEYGSPKEPMIKEAFILSQLDEIDAKMNLINNQLNNVEVNEMSGPIMAFDKRRFLNLQ